MEKNPTLVTRKQLGQRLLIVALVALLAACAQPQEVAHNRSDQLETELATKTFSSGYRHISERYIEAIPAAELALEGLRGLATIDPTLSVEAHQNEVLVRSDSIQAHRYSAPAKHDFRGWAELTVLVLGDIRNDARLFKTTKMANLYEAVFDGSLSLLDAFSRYASVEKAKRNREKRSGFGGIGIRFKPVEKGVTVTQVFPETPATKSGLKAGDIITHAGSQILAGLKRRAAGKLLRGKIGSIVDVRVLRPANLTAPTNPFIRLNFSIRRDRIVTPTASHSVKNGIIYIRVSGFNNRTTRQVARNLVQGLREAHQQTGQKAKGIILDLRGNPGGLLKQAVNVSDLFLVDGRIISTRGRHPASDHDYDARGTDLADGLPLVVLINGRSASASEIVAAALQDHERAIIIGSTSYGKGTVQTVIRLPNDAEITLTWSRFQAPSGYFLHGLGVPPLICATRNEQANATNYIDEALEKAGQLSETLQAWHSVAISQKSERERLKATCPTTNKRNPLDIQIAEKLLLDASLYQRVKALNPSLASAK
ncbi:MAG: S41 family peptidase [Rhodospirillaceae bacterium]|nr:S41 family peptidase [Rhodospirillaceae bacterium]MBT4588770.1 S41 family peptidase [Rhodospirillaceae bacterium]MBT4937939.1 S41 family peptidase [Rhodospirillaceae bacterium]MBT5940185.1 S41 family peptidase [Rhodospirillaceae bacterium]MBT7267759.1 S41 family peptidase [Rhodospirillaceae bacterium]